MTIINPSMLVYSFAPKLLLSDNRLYENARNHLRHLWEACSRLGMTGSSQRLNLPVDFPTNLNLNDSGFRVLAAKVDNKRLARKIYYQAFLFEYQDVFGLIAALETGEKCEGWPRWRELYDEWNQCVKVKGLPEGMMGEAYIYSGACGDQTLLPSDTDADGEGLMSGIAAQIGEPAIEALPASDNDQRRAATFYLSERQFCFWEGGSPDDHRIIALLVPRSEMKAAFRWAVWPDSSQLAPFARYLLHASKLRFAQRVFEHEVPTLRGRRKPIDTVLEDIIKLQKRLASDRPIGATDIARAQYDLGQSQIENYALLYSVSRLKELRLTAQIARRNLQQLIPKHHPAHSPTNLSLFDQDIARADWLQEQILMDLEYLDAVGTRVTEGHKIIAMRLEQEAQKNARQLNSLVLLQSSLLGALVVSLTAIQAFQPASVLPGALIWPLVGLLAALALALPPLFARWSDTYQKIDRFVGGLVGAAIFLFAITLWDVLQLPSYRVSYPLWILYRVFSTAIGFFIGYRSIGLLDRMKVPARKPEGEPLKEEHQDGY